MGRYKVVITATVRKYLDKLSDKIAAPLLTALQSLSENPRPHGYKKLKGRSGFRIRKGDYRIIYEIEDDNLIVDVIAIGNRRDVYE
ncbi:MAG TPA: type II toxin-antitoxin system RelE/ParE family toxin [Chitinophagales bacterium]|nr:type II toxin-antitoxin system RelE/ParE family toxin [Chitinophagales bacterium]